MDENKEEDMRFTYETIRQQIERVVQESFKSGKRRITEVVLDDYEWAEFTQHVAVHPYATSWTIEIMPSIMSINPSYDQYNDPVDIDHNRVVVRKQYKTATEAAIQQAQAYKAYSRIMRGL
jgi:hypothetical protein